MNDLKLEKKIQQDAANVVRDVTTLAEDGAVRLGRVEDNLKQATGKAKEDITTWVEGGVTQLGDKLEEMSNEARKTVVEGAVMVKQDVEHGLIQYNEKAKELAGKVPGRFGEKVGKYPWVAISIALGIGLLVGGILVQLFRRTISQPQI